MSIARARNGMKKSNLANAGSKAAGIAPSI